MIVWRNRSNDFRNIETRINDYANQMRTFSKKKKIRRKSTDNMSYQRKQLGIQWKSILTESRCASCIPNGRKRIRYEFFVCVELWSVLRRQVDSTGCTKIACIVIAQISLSLPPSHLLDCRVRYRRKSVLFSFLLLSFLLFNLVFKLFIRVARHAFWIPSVCAYIFHEKSFVVVRSVDSAYCSFAKLAICFRIICTTTTTSHIISFTRTAAKLPNSMSTSFAGTWFRFNLARWRDGARWCLIGVAEMDVRIASSYLIPMLIE